MKYIHIIIYITIFASFLRPNVALQALLSQIPQFTYETLRNSKKNFLKTNVNSSWENNNQPKKDAKKDMTLDFQPKT